MREFSNRPHSLLGSGWTFGTVGSTDLDRVDEWWTAAPWANIGIDSGASGLLVLDHDVKRADEDGIRSMLDWLDETGCAMPDGAPTVRTPSGGLHVYLRVTEPVRFVHSWLPSVDAQGDGACVAAPPSFRRAAVPPKAGEHRRDAGEVVLPYQVLNGDLTAIPPAPAELVDAVRRGRWWVTEARAAQFGGSSDLPATDWLMEHGFTPGERDRQCHRLACRLWSMHWPHEELVISRVHATWLATEQPPGDVFTWAQAMKCVDSARRFIVPQLRQELAWAEQLRKQS